MEKHNTEDVLNSIPVSQDQINSLLKYLVFEAFSFSVLSFR